METWNELDEWADRYVRGDLSREDRIALMKWLEASPEHIGPVSKDTSSRNAGRGCGKVATVRPDTGTGVETYYSGLCES